MKTSEMLEKNIIILVVIFLQKIMVTITLGLLLLPVYKNRI